MLIINSKRIKIILAFLLISLFTFSCNTIKYEKNNVNNKTVETTATPVSGKTVYTRKQQDIINPRGRTIKKRHDYSTSGYKKTAGRSGQDETPKIPASLRMCSRSRRAQPYSDFIRLYQNTS